MVVTVLAFALEGISQNMVTLPCRKMSAGAKFVYEYFPDTKKSEKHLLTTTIISNNGTDIVTSTNSAIKEDGVLLNGTSTTLTFYKVSGENIYIVKSDLSGQSFKYDCEYLMVKQLCGRMLSHRKDSLRCIQQVGNDKPNTYQFVYKTSLIYMGKETISTKAGKFNAFIFRETVERDLPDGKSKDITTSYEVPEIGTVKSITVSILDRKEPLPEKTDPISKSKMDKALDALAKGDTNAMKIFDDPTYMKAQKELTKFKIVHSKHTSTRELVSYYIK